MTVVIDLPWPPSVNALWRGSGRRVYRSKRYMDWIKQAEIHWMIQRPKNKIREIKGEFSLSLILNPPTKRLSDIDNFTKAPMDFLQRMAIIENDNLCRTLIVTYGDKSSAPLGVRLTVSPY